MINFYRLSAGPAAASGCRRPSQNCASIADSTDPCRCTTPAPGFRMNRQGVGVCQVEGRLAGG